MAHRFRFYRAGGVDQVQLKTGADLLALRELDQKLWVALSCPVIGLEFDTRTLALIDTDKDGKVRAPELLLAIEWAARVLVDIEGLARPDEPLTLSAVSDESDEGRLIRDTMRSLLGGLGKAEDSPMSVEETVKALDTFNHLAENGDGVVPATATPDEELKALIVAVLSGVSEPKQDRSGDPGVSAENVQAFFEALEQRRTWGKQGETGELRTLGVHGESAFAAFLAVRDKVEDYFARTRIVAFDERATSAMNGHETPFAALGGSVIGRAVSELESFPLAHVTPASSLPLEHAVNPAWAERVAAFRTKTVDPLLGAKSQLTEREFRDIETRLAAHSEWYQKKPTTPWDGIEWTRAEPWLEGTAKERLNALIAADQAAAPRAGAIESVEKLVRLKQGLLRLSNNFVAFREFYRPGGHAVFQIGTLYLDQRALGLVLRVNDVTRHISMGPLASMYLVYCDVKNAKGQAMQVVAAVTNGDVDNLMVGRNGLFYDLSGGDWDATIVRIVENPISIRQAFWSPYKKLVRLIEEQVSKRAAAAQAEADANVGSKALAIDAATKGEVKAAEPAPKKLDIGIVAALGVAVGGITAALGVFVQAFTGLGLWMPLGVLGLMLVISGPAMAVAGLKLRRRNIGPLLDANGWAINVMPRVNIALGRSLTQLATLPPGTPRDLVDPFAEKKPPVWRTLLALVVVILLIGWVLGRLDSHLPAKYQSTTVLGEAAPARVKAQPAAPSAPTAPAAPAAKP
jgi:hypothetical protein